METSDFNIPVDNNNDRIEETLENSDDSAAVHGGKTVNGAVPEKKTLGIKRAVEKMKYLNAFSKVKPATDALNGLNFISKKDAHEQFDKLTEASDGLLHRSRFGECIGMNNDSKEFAEGLFDSLCRRRNISDDSINKAQFKDFWAEISNKRFDSRLRIFLDMVDKDKDGKITEDELKEIIRVSASANKLSNIKNHAGKYATLIMGELDPNNLGYIKIEKLEKLLKDAATQNKREREESSKSSKQEQKPIRRWYEDLKYYLEENREKCWVIILWVGIMVCLFTWKYIQYKNRAVYDVLGACVSIAKGSAETLKLNMAIMLLLVCRNTITWFRNKTSLGLVVPFDDNISFHQVVAIAIAIGVGLHSISHLTCDFPRLIHATEEEYKPMQQFFGDQPENYWHFLKEVEGYTGITMVVLMTIAFTLAWLGQSKLKLPSILNKQSTYNAFKNSKLYDAFINKLKEFIANLNKLIGFNVFWYSHHLFVIVYAMLIVHGIKLYLTKEWYKKTTWMYLAVPVSLYACERLVRSFRSRFEPSRILKVTAYPGPRGVLALRMAKPNNFKYKSGQYMFLKCAAVSPFEWHPFSITSAPGDDYLSVHIRADGDWTEKIYEIFSKVCPLDEETRIRSADFPGENPNIPKVRIDGPYGAPAQDYKRYKVVLLVGLGIGATPMISIVKDIVNNMKAKEEEANALENGDVLQTRKSSPTRENDFRTTRAYFYWVTKEQESFDWFEGVMNEVAKVDKNGIIDMHNYCTSVYEKGDARSALITMLQSLNHAKNGIDVVSGTRFKSHFGKPDWKDVYSQIAVNHKDPEIGVFFCGAQPAAKDLKQLSSDFSHDNSTKFVFHKENF